MTGYQLVAGPRTRTMIMGANETGSMS